MKYYRLLRNNKESGPYGADDLIKAGFKPYDLVWEEGKSAAWRYTSEIAELKQFAPVLEEQPFDRFYKKSKPALQSKLPANQSVSIAVIDQPVTAKKEKPRIRIKADTSKIENAKPEVIEQEQIFAKTPYVTTQAENKNGSITVPRPPKPKWENIWLDWEEEKKTVENLKFKKEPESEPEPEIETKFSQSFDDIKELYIEKVLNGKKPAFAFEQYKGYIGVCVISLCVLAIGIWVGIQWCGDDETKQHLLGNTPRQEIFEQINETHENSSPPSEADLNKSKPTTVIIVPTVEKNYSSTITKSKSGSKTISAKASVKPVTTAGDNIKTNSQIPTATKPTIINQKNVTENISAEKKHEDVVVSKQTTNEKNIEDYIALRSIGNSGATGVSYKVENISDVALEMVMIDLQYFDAAGRFKKGETIYVRNINPGQSVSVKAPDDANASKITSKISMISSEQSNLYLIAD